MNNASNDPPRDPSRRNALKSLALGGGMAAAGLPVLSACGSPEHPATAPPAPYTAGAVANESAGLTGRLVFPGHADYNKARALWDKLFDIYPKVIVYCQNEQDVVNAVTHARQNGIAFRARSGGHALEGWSSVDGGITIDLSGLNSASIDAASKTATIGTGLVSMQVVKALEKTPFGFPTGVEADVGVGGAILGGGIGRSSRAWGLASDNLLGLDLVVADGEGARVIRVDQSNNPDLLWASRGGGGGNFGIATSFTLQLHDVPSPIGAWHISWPFGSFVEAFSAWQQWAPRADNRLGSTFNLGTPAVGIDVDGTFLGPEDQLAGLLEPLTKIRGAQLKTSSKPWAQYFIDSNATPDTLFSWKFAATWINEPLSADTLQAVSRMLSTAPSGGCTFWCLAWGGVVQKEPAGGSAFPWRSSIFYAEPGAGWNGMENNASHLGWIADFRALLRPVSGGGYVNVPDRSIADWGAQYYGQNFARLREIKKTYDPNNVFSFEQSIPLS